MKFLLIVSLFFACEIANAGNWKRVEFRTNYAIFTIDNKHLSCKSDRATDQYFMVLIIDPGALDTELNHYLMRGGHFKSRFECENALEDIFESSPVEMELFYEFETARGQHCHLFGCDDFIREDLYVDLETIEFHSHANF